MMFDEALLWLYRGLAGIVAVMMVLTMLRAGSWRTQLFAALVFVPFALRAAGVK